MRLFVAAIVIAAVPLVAFAQPPARSRPDAAGAISTPLSPRNANYSIDARLGADERAITGSERITWRNITSKPATELQFHLYWNAWRNARSTWLREAWLGGRTFEGLRDRDWGRTDVTSIRLLDGERPTDLTALKHFTAPDDGNPDDETVLAVPLPQPLPPEGSITIEVLWSAHVPRTFARTGAIGNFFFIAQWFPKLG